MLEGAIKGNVFCFTDDKGKRQEINQKLSKSAGFIENLFNKTRGREKSALDDKVRMFHIFEGQLKSSQDIQSGMRLEREADEWKQEKEDLWKQMTQIFNEKDKAVSHVHTKNLKTMLQLWRNFLQFKLIKRGNHFLPVKTKEEH